MVRIQNHRKSQLRITMGRDQRVQRTVEAAIPTWELESRGKI